MTKTIKPETSRDSLSWTDLETLETVRPEDPDRLFSSDPETDKTWRADRIEIDPETVSLFLSYCSKINRITKKSDKRLSSLRSDLNTHIMENVT